MPEIPQPPLLACDITTCGSTAGAAKYAVRVGTATAAVILCGKHGEPLVEAHRAGTIETPRRPPVRSLETLHVD